MLKKRMKREQIELLIKNNEEVFEGAFLMNKPSEEAVKIAEQQLGFTIPECYLWFLNRYGYGGFFFEFLGYGLTKEAIFAQETLKQRENGLPKNLMVFENCDEYVVCIDVQDGSIVSWSHYDKDGIIKKNDCFEDYFLECLNNAIENY